MIRSRVTTVTLGALALGLISGSALSQNINLYYSTVRSEVRNDGGYSADRRAAHNKCWDQLERGGELKKDKICDATHSVSRRCGAYGQFCPEDHKVRARVTNVRYVKARRKGSVVDVDLRYDVGGSYWICFRDTGKCSSKRSFTRRNLDGSWILQRR